MEHLRQLESELVSAVRGKEKILKELEEEERTCAKRWERFISDKSRFEAELSHYNSNKEDLSRRIKSVDEEISKLGLGKAPADIERMLEDNKDILSDNVKFARHTQKIRSEIEDLASIQVPLEYPEMTNEEIEDTNDKAERYSRYIECESLWKDISEDVLKYIGLSGSLPDLQEIEVAISSLRKLSQSIDSNIVEVRTADEKAKWRESELKKRRDTVNIIDTKMSNISKGLPDIVSSECVVKSKDVYDAITAIDVELKDLKNKLSDAEIADKFLAIHCDISELEVELKAMEDDSRAISKLLELCDATQHEIMESKLATVNGGLYSLSGSVMEGETELRLQCYRDIKSNHTKKTQVNLEVFSGGSSCDGIKVLSGGERARACISLLMALHQHTAFPFMFFDETMAFIGSSLKSVVLEELKRDFLYSGKGVLFVMHDGVKGLFDEEINLDDECCSGDRLKY